MSYADFVAEQKAKDASHREGSVAWLIVRFIREMSNEHMKPLGDSHYYGLMAITRSSLGRKGAAGLKKSDIMDYCKARRDAGVAPQTILQDLARLSGVLKYAPSAWDDCEEVSDGAIAAAKPMLKKHGLIGKGEPRKRRPTDEELQRLIAYLGDQDARPRTHVKVVPCLLFALASTRRRGEIVRLMHGDIDWDRKAADGTPTPMYMIRDLKHPTRKKGNDKWFPLFPELAEIIRRQPRLRPDDPKERVFPYDGKSVGARYTLAKKALGIVNLRFHDNRREAISRYLKVLPPHEVRQISGHETTVILERVYDQRDPADLHAKLKHAPHATA